MPVSYTHTSSWQDVKKKISVAECHKIVIANLPTELSNFEIKAQENFIKYAQLEIFSIAKDLKLVDKNFKEQVCPKIVSKSFTIFLAKQKYNGRNIQLNSIISEAKQKFHEEYKTNIYPIIDANDGFDENEKSLLKNYTYQCGMDKLQKKKIELVLKISNYNVSINWNVFSSFIVTKVFLNCVNKAFEATYVSLENQPKCFKEFHSCFDSKEYLYKIKNNYSNANIAEVEERFEDHILNLRLELIEKIKDNRFCLSDKLNTYVFSAVLNKFREDYRESKIILPINYELIDEYVEQDNHTGNMILYFLTDHEYTKTLDPMKVDIFKMDLEGIKDDKIAEKYKETVDNIRQIRSRTRKKALQFLIKNAQMIGKWIKQHDIDG